MAETWTNKKKKGATTNTSSSVPICRYRQNAWKVFHREIQIVLESYLTKELILIKGFGDVLLKVLTNEKRGG